MLVLWQKSRYIRRECSISNRREIQLIILNRVRGAHYGNIRIRLSFQCIYVEKLHLSSARIMMDMLGYHMIRNNTSRSWVNTKVASLSQSCENLVLFLFVHGISL